MHILPGATGVELAAEIYHTICELRSYGANIFHDQLQITIMEGSNRILGGGPESLSKFATSELKKRDIDVRTNCMIKAVTEEGFALQDGSVIPAEIKIWTAGIKAPKWLSQLGLSVNNLNQIKVNQKLQSVEDTNILAMGDCAYAPDGVSGRFLPATVSALHTFVFL
jgi:NADH dehydrogenase